MVNKNLVNKNLIDIIEEHLPFIMTFNPPLKLWGDKEIDAGIITCNTKACLKILAKEIEEIKDYLKGKEYINPNQLEFGFKEK